MDPSLETVFVETTWWKWWTKWNHAEFRSRWRPQTCQELKVSGASYWFSFCASVNHLRFLPFAVVLDWAKMRLIWWRKPCTATRHRWHHQSSYLTIKLNQTTHSPALKGLFYVVFRSFSLAASVNARLFCQKEMDKSVVESCWLPETMTSPNPLNGLCLGMSCYFVLFFAANWNLQDMPKFEPEIPNWKVSRCDGVDRMPSGPRKPRIEDTSRRTIIGMVAGSAQSTALRERQEKVMAPEHGLPYTEKQETQHQGHVQHRFLVRCHSQLWRLLFGFAGACCTLLEHW